MFFNYCLFIIFSIILASGTLMIITDNPIHAILFLIAIFFNGSILFFLLNFEFFALIFLIIYVGAIIVLFLFMIMLLNIKQNDFKNLGGFKTIKYYSFIGYFIFIFLSQFIYYSREVLSPTIDLFSEFIEIKLINLNLISGSNYQNLVTLGKELYSNNILSFIIIAILLTIGMIGAIVIAFEETSKNKKIFLKTQDSVVQAERNAQNSVYFSFKEFFFLNSLEEKNLKVKLLLKKN